MEYEIRLPGEDVVHKISAKDQTEAAANFVLNHCNVAARPVASLSQGLNVEVRAGIGPWKTIEVRMQVRVSIREIKGARSILRLVREDA